MSPRRAQVTALLDQLDAAGDHALRNLTGVAGHLGGQLTEQSPPPALRRILTRLDTHLKAGQVTTCRHLSPNAPAPTWWPAWAPGRIRCASCTERTSERIKGTREDRRCDACSRMAGGTVYLGAVLLPGALAELPGFIGVWPPVTVLFGLCAACRIPGPRHG
jgi:hypothetical protein